MPSVAAPDELHIIACGALAGELRAVLGQLGASDTVTVEYLASSLHNHPDQIPGRVDDMLTHHAGKRLVVAYADCGTGGLLDVVLERHGVERLPGAHCYEFFAGSDTFHALHDAEPGTFYLTDFLARHFHQLVWVGLGLDRHPELRDSYFGNYTRVVLLAQSNDPGIEATARAAATQLGLAFELHPVGRTPFRRSLSHLLTKVAV